MQQERSRSRSRSSDRSSSRSGSSGGEDRRGLREKVVTPGLWDSMRKVTEPKTAAPPPRKPKQGLVVDIGKKVDIHGLSGAAQYNGLEGRVTAGPNEKGRWLVQLIYQGGMKELALLAQNLQPKPPCGWEIVVAGISMTTTEQDVMQVFSKFGQIQSAKVTRDLNGVSKGVALVVMSHRESAEKALAAGPEIDIGGIPAKVQWSTMVKQEMGLLKTRDEENDADVGTRRTFQEGQEASAGSRCVDPPPDSPFKVGQAVLVSGLKAAPQFNGLTGRVQGIRADGRCEVLLHCDGESKVVALKPDNLADAPGAGAGAAAGERGADAAPAAEAAEGAEAEAKRRRRKSAWGEINQGGEVYVGRTSSAAEQPEGAGEA